MNEIETIEVPHPFTADCEVCGSCDSDEERQARIESCKIAEAAYREGYQAGGRGLRQILVTFMIEDPEDKQRKGFGFVGLFAANKRTRLSGDFESLRFFDKRGEIEITDSEESKRLLRHGKLVSFEIEVNDAPLFGHHSKMVVIDDVLERG